MKISFVIPCYNEAGNVRNIYEAIRSVFGAEGIPAELIMVNDGSKDDTKTALRELYREKSDPDLCVVSFSRNFGKEAAMFAGLHHVTGDYVCFIDADMQQRPEVALEMFRKLREDPGLDCVGAFQEKRGESKVLSFFKKSFYRLINTLCDTKFYPGASDFRMMTRQMADSVLSLSEYSRFSKGLFSWVGYNTLYIPYEAEERASGTSSWSFWKLFKYALEGILGYTTAPLTVSAFFGGGMLGIAFVLFLVLLIRSLLPGVCVSGTAWIIDTVLAVGGLNLLFTGVLGAYLAKTYLQIKGRPVYIEKEILRNSEKG